MIEVLLHFATMSCIFGIGAVSLNLQAGTSGLFNFGQVIFAAIGAYATAIATTHGFSPLLGLAAGLAAGALAGVALALIAGNLNADYWALSSLATAELLRVIALNEDWLTGGAQGLANVPKLFPLSGTSLSLANLGLAAAGLLLVATVAWRLTHAQYGRILRLQREHPDYAASLGYDIFHVRAVVMAIAGGIGALSGFLFAHYFTYVGTEQLLVIETFLLWSMVIIGGAGNVKGVIVGAFAVELIYAGTPFLKDLAGLDSQIAANLRVALIGTALLLFLLHKPDGLLPERVGRFRVPG